MFTESSRSIRLFDGMGIGHHIIDLKALVKVVLISDGFLNKCTAKKKSNVIIIVKEGEQWLGYYLFICIYTYFFFFAGPTRFSSFPEDDVRVFFVIINLFICFFFEWGATVVLQSAQINLCG